MAACIISGCKHEEGNPFKINEKNDGFSYYPETSMNEDNHLYVFGQEDGRQINPQELILGQTIQGLFARKGVKHYYSNGSNIHESWLNDLKDTYNMTFERVTINDIILQYMDEYLNGGYILYDYSNNKESLNVANTLSGIMDCFIVDKSLESKVIDLGIEKKLDVSDKKERWCFDNYKDQLNKRIVQIKHDLPALRDYGVTFKYFYTYQDGVGPSVLTFRGEVHDWAEKDAPIFGWGPISEDSHVGIASRNGQFTIPSDHCYNTTVFSARDFYSLESVKQPNEKETITAEIGKHYVTIVRSDGDNVQTWFNTFPFSTNDMAAPRGDFKMGWSTQPSLIDIAPSIIDYSYRNADKNDYFVAAVSGHGYMYPTLYPKLADYLGGLNAYLKRTDLNIVQILDSGPNADVIEWYSQVDSLKGGMYLYGEKYMEGLGEIFWSKNGKPFVSCRDSLWDINASDIAHRVNGYSKDPKTIGGYTMINLHPWSRTYADVVDMVNMFDDHVVVVSPEAFIDLIIENVPKVNAKP